MGGRRQPSDQVSTGFVFTALVLGLILTPFVKCGQAIGCVSEDFGEAKALLQDEQEERPIKVSNPGAQEAARWDEPYEYGR
jgi:hypothetical protein